MPSGDLGAMRFGSAGLFRIVFEDPYIGSPFGSLLVNRFYRESGNAPPSLLIRNRNMTAEYDG